MRKNVLVVWLYAPVVCVQKIYDPRQEVAWAIADCLEIGVSENARLGEAQSCLLKQMGVSISYRSSHESINLRKSVIASDAASSNALTSSNGRVSLKQLSHTSLTARSASSGLLHAGLAMTESIARRRAHA